MIATFDTKEKAIQYVRDTLGADPDGKINLVSCFGVDDEDVVPECPTGYSADAHENKLCDCK